MLSKRVYCRIVLPVLALGFSTGAYAMGRPKPSANLQYVESGSKIQISSGNQLLALKNGNIYSSSTWGKGITFISPDGTVLRQISVPDLPGRAIQLKDGTVVVPIRGGLLNFYTQNGDSIASVPVSTDAAFKNEWASIPHLKASSDGSNAIVTFEGEKNLSTVPNVYDTETIGIFEIFNSKGQSLTQYQLDGRPDYFGELSDGSYYVEGTPIGGGKGSMTHLSSVGTPLTGAPASNLVFLGAFPDGNVVMMSTKAFYVYSVDWKTQLAEYRIPDKMRLAGEAAITSSGLLVVPVGSEYADGSGVGFVFLNEKCEPVRPPLTVKGENARLENLPDGSFALEYQPYTFAAGIVPVAGLPIPIPVWTRHDLSNDVAYVFFDANGSQGGSYRLHSSDIDPVAPVIEVGKYAVVSAAGKAFYVDRSTGKAVADFPASNGAYAKARSGSDLIAVTYGGNHIARVTLKSP